MLTIHVVYQMSKKRYTIVATTYDSKGRQLSTATNSYSKTHPVQAFYAKQVNQPKRIYLHAEILAILRAGDSVIHTIKITNLSGSLSNPCPVCMAAIKAYGIKKIVCQ